MVAGGGTASKLRLRRISCLTESASWRRRKMKGTVLANAWLRLGSPTKLVILPQPRTIHPRVALDRYDHLTSKAQSFLGTKDTQCACRMGCDE